MTATVTARTEILARYIATDERMRAARAAGDHGTANELSDELFHSARHHGITAEEIDAARTIAAGPFTAARVQGRYRVLDEAGQIVVTLNSKAKAEARAAELNREAASFVQPITDAEIEAEGFIAPTTAEEEQAMAEGRIADVLLGRAGVDAAEAQEPAEERQEAPAEGAGTSDTPAQEEEPQGAAQPVEKPAPIIHGKDQPAPHAFTTVGTKIKNHCTDCGRSWAAASHRKFREAQAETVEETPAAEGEWTPAPDDTTEDGKAPAESAQG